MVHNFYLQSCPGIDNTYCKNISGQETPSCLYCSIVFRSPIGQKAGGGLTCNALKSCRYSFTASVLILRIRPAFDLSHCLIIHTYFHISPFSTGQSFCHTEGCLLRSYSIRLRIRWICCRTILRKVSALADARIFISMVAYTFSKRYLPGAGRRTGASNATTLSHDLP